MPKPFTKIFLEKQKALLLKLKVELLNNLAEKKNEDLFVATDEVVEDGDQAQTYLNQNVSFGLRERELRRIKEIEHALSKIEQGFYGLCEEYDEPIEIKRLEKMPWTRFCIQAAEELEREGNAQFAI